MSKPIVAVVGRPNVGKSTLFNKLCGQRLAIVEDTPGITRDRIFANCEWNGHEFLLVDTGGIEPKATEGILAHMREQAQIAIDTADCIIMVVDVRDGLTAADEDVAHMLRRSHKPIILAVNKCDKVGPSRPCTVTAPATYWMPCARTWTSAKRWWKRTASRWPSSAAPTWASPA